MEPSQLEKAKRFRALHEAPGFFVVANAWDAGSARILAGLGFVEARARVSTLSRISNQPGLALSQSRAAARRTSSSAAAASGNVGIVPLR